MCLKFLNSQSTVHFFAASEKKSIQFFPRKLHPAQATTNTQIYIYIYKADKTLLGHCNKSTHHATKIQFHEKKETERKIKDK